MWLSKNGMKIGFFMSTDLETFRNFKIWHTFDKEK